ncbi:MULTISPECIES: helix-turn-helix domain-containing protein [Thermus]|uniref:helix-turn-helix domain-containing protein n=1 Tax=Thermus brockianus TaxID=56956 RepID=UPI003AF083CC
MSLRELRQLGGLSIGELSRITGLSRSYLWRLERGQRKLGGKAILLLTKALSRHLALPQDAILTMLMGESATTALSQRTAVGGEPAPRYLTVDQAARYLGVSRSYIKNAVRSGRLRPRPVPGPRGQMVFSIEELQSFAKRYLESAEVTAE